MTSRAFSRPFHEELECEILERLGQHDLLSTSLVCRRFHAISAPLLLRHIARHEMFVNEHGERSTMRLLNAHKVVARLLHDGDLCRHVRYFDMPTVALDTVQPDALRAMWLSMTNLVALSLKGRWFAAGVFDRSIDDVYFPRLRRLRVHSNTLSPSLITLHIDSLTHLRFDDDVILPSDDIQPKYLTHYHGPLDAILRLASHAKTLQVCSIRERVAYGRTDWPSLSSLTACRSLRMLMVVLEVPEADLLRMLKNCPRFPSIDTLTLLYKTAWSNPTQVNPQDLREPYFERLLAPFPTAKRIAVFDDYWDDEDESDNNWLKERGPVWAERVSKTCINAEFITFGDECSFARGPGQRWMTSTLMWEFEETFGQWVVPAVPG